jgi:dipeptidyl aminopeptidase/acylaminoacyl peptidase
MRKFFISALILSTFALSAQQHLTPALLWKLGRLSGPSLSKDKQYVYYTVSTPDVDSNKFNRQGWMISVNGGSPVRINNLDSAIVNNKISPDGHYIVSDSQVKVINVAGKDFYKELSKSNAQIYTSLGHRSWDHWEDGDFNHIFLASYTNGKAGEKKDITKDEPYDNPGRDDVSNMDYVWNPDGKHIVYVAMKKQGTPSVLSYNVDLYSYDISTGKTENLTSNNKGDDEQPAFSANGKLAWVKSSNEFYGADKKDLVVANGSTVVNLTHHRDDIHVMSFKWSNDGSHLYFTAPIDGTIQLFEVDDIGLTKKIPSIRQITKGDFDITAVVGQSGNKLIVTRNDMNHAPELFTADIASGNMQQLSHINDSVYNTIGMVKTERRWITTTDNQKMLVWVIYPPAFDASKKYPTLLYCQGGPQSPLTQSYSFRWNFQLIASQGYIVVAPNRRGMPGHGTKWNEQVSKDWGGQVLQDYLSAIDAVSKEPFVDKNRLGCVGASFGGYSAFALEGIHNGRFKTFIAHDGVFDFKSLYGTFDGMAFLNWEFGGPYWDRSNKAAQRSYAQSPSNLVDKWNAPILIVQGGRDYRVPIEQGLQAFTAAQLRGIRSKLLYFPEENHWVLSPQNALVWQREFFGWLDETLKGNKVY